MYLSDSCRPSSCLLTPAAPTPARERPCPRSSGWRTGADLSASETIKDDVTASLLGAVKIYGRGAERRSARCWKRQRGRPRSRGPADPPSPPLLAAVANK